jgi:hypothetical protein
LNLKWKNCFQKFAFKFNLYRYTLYSTYYEDAEEAAEYHDHSVLMSAAGPVLGLDESVEVDAWERGGGGGGGGGDGGVRLSAEMSSPRLLSRRAPVATVSALERGKAQRHSIDRPLTAGPSRPTPGGGGGGGGGSRPGSVTRARPSSSVTPSGASLHARTPGGGANPSPATSPQRRRGHASHGGVQYKTHATTEKFMPIHAGSNQTAAAAHLSAIRSNAMGASIISASTTTPYTAVRAGGKARPLSASAAAALKHAVPTPGSGGRGLSRGLHSSTRLSLISAVLKPLYYH